VADVALPVSYPIDQKRDTVHKTNATSKRMAHRANLKVTAQHRKSIVVNGRIVGPRVERAVAVTTKKTASRSMKKDAGDALALQDKLGMSLDALVKRNGK
jgi:hypothetical protein